MPNPINSAETLRADPAMIKTWSERTKCWMCKHHFDQPVILRVSRPERGKFQPNFNTEVLFHLQDTHGIPQTAIRRMIVNSIYGIKSTMQSLYGETL